MTAAKFLAERYNYITWLRDRDEISADTADEWRAKFLNKAKKMEEQQLVCDECGDEAIYNTNHGNFCRCCRPF